MKLEMRTTESSIQRYLSVSGRYYGSRGFFSPRISTPVSYGLIDTVPGGGPRTRPFRGAAGTAEEAQQAAIDTVSLWFNSQSKPETTQDGRMVLEPEQFRYHNGQGAHNRYVAELDQCKICVL